MDIPVKWTGKHLILRPVPPCLGAGREGIWADDRNGKTSLTPTDQAKRPTGPPPHQQLQGLRGPYLARDPHPPHTLLGAGAPRALPALGSPVTIAPAPALRGIPTKGPASCRPQSVGCVPFCTHSTQACVPLTLRRCKSKSPSLVAEPQTRRNPRRNAALVMGVGWVGEGGGGGMPGSQNPVPPTSPPPSYLYACLQGTLSIHTPERRIRREDTLHLLPTKTASASQLQTNSRRKDLSLSSP